MEVLSKNDFFEKAKPKIEKLPLPELGKDKVVFIKGMSADERDALEGSVVVLSEDGTQIVKFDKTSFRAKVICLTACDKDGNLIFNQDDIDRVGQLDGRVISKMFDVAQRLSGMAKADVDQMVKK